MLSCGAMCGAPDHHLLGEDLTCLVRALGVELVDVRPITCLPSASSGRASFRLEFADGRVLKGRRSEWAGAVQRRLRVESLLTDQPLTRIVGAKGVAVLEQWADGQALTADGCSESCMREVGELLGRLHAIVVPPDMLDAEDGLAEGKRRELDHSLLGLVDGGVLSRMQAVELRELGQANCPEMLAGGCVHGDLHYSNLLRMGRGGLILVDNESLRIDAIDLDLATVAQRWPMDASDWLAFRSGYSHWRPTAEYDGHSAFWQTWSLARSTLFRVRRESPYRSQLAALLGLI